MKIRLTGDLDLDLKKIGIKTGDEFTAYPEPGNKTGAVNFLKMYNGFINDCVVWPDNYEVID